MAAAEAQSEGQLHQLDLTGVIGNNDELDAATRITESPLMVQFCYLESNAPPLSRTKHPNKIIAAVK